MQNTPVLHAVLGAVLVLSSAASVPAQDVETIGVRAQGMGGAFVAVADDATATWWNPAGLAGGAYVDAVLELDRVKEPRHGGGTDTPAWRAGAAGFAVAFPALGLSYYRLRISEIRPSGTTGLPTAGRQDPRPVDVRLAQLSVGQFGATVGQSLGDHLVVGSTLKLLRGSYASEARAGAGASLDRADGLEGDAETHGDLDVGAMASFGAVRLGATIRNLTEPSFRGPAGERALKRQVRAGLSMHSGPIGRVEAVTVAVDADLTSTPAASGDARQVALGAEAWLFQRRVGVRGGASASTVGQARWAGAGGASLAVRQRWYFDAQATIGGEQSRRGLGLGLRVTF